MTLQYDLKTRPLDYIVLDDLLTPDIIEELYNWFESMTLLDPESTGAATGLSGKDLKKSYGIFVPPDNTSLIDRLMSFILRSLSEEESMEKLKSAPLFYSIFKNREGTTFSQAKGYVRSYLVASYDDGDKYESHSDSTVITALLWLKTKDADFTGGDLRFTDFDEEVEFKHNRMVIFQGPMFHEVTPVCGNGRISITTFFGEKPERIVETPMLTKSTYDSDGIDWRKEEVSAEKVI